MELVRVKIKGTDDVAVLGKFENEGRVLYRGTGEKVFTPDEVEELGPYEGPQPQQQPDDPLAQLPTEMVQMITDMVNGYIDRFDAMYWQRQRVEILKILLQRGDTHPSADKHRTVELADEYIQMLKNYE